mgnify:FL=1
MKKRIFVGVALFAAFLAVVVLDIFWLNFAIFGVLLAIAVLESLKLYGLKEKSLAVIAVAFFTLLPFIGGIQDIFKIILLNLIVVASILAYTKNENLKLILPFIYPTAPMFMLFAIYTVLQWIK